MVRPPSSPARHAPVPESVGVPAPSTVPHPGSGTMARPLTGTGVTVPEMPAVRPHFPSYRDSSPRHSWVDQHAEPDTEQTGRATEIDPIPVHTERRDRAVLLRMDGVHAGQIFSLQGERLTIGRQSDNDLVIDDPGVSRQHAVILKVGLDWVIQESGAKNGTVVQGRRVQNSVLHDGDFVQLGPRVAFRFSLTDMKQEKLLHRLYESSNRDALTGAYNRKHFDERVLGEVAYATRHRSEAALILFDVDHFKKVNDTRGHAAGDAVLRHISGIVHSRLRTEDMFARIGGEEFAVLLRGVTLVGAVRLAERLRGSISASPALFEGSSVPVTVSLGCASLTCLEVASAAELLKLADERLYEAKTSGRNRVVGAPAPSA